LKNINISRSYELLFKETAYILKQQYYEILNF